MPGEQVLGVTPGLAIRRITTGFLPWSGVTMSADAAGHGLRVRVGRMTLPADQPSAVTEAVELFNAGNRIANLPDALNPSIIDAGKVAAFLAAVARLPSVTLAALVGRSLYLNAPDLPLRTTSPTTPGSFSRMSGLEVTDLQGDTALTLARVPIDRGLAQLHADSARKALASMEQVIAAQSRRHAAAGDGPDQVAALLALSAARARGLAIAHTWLENATAVSACDPDDAAARADQDAAWRAVLAFAASSAEGSW